MAASDGVKPDYYIHVYHDGFSETERFWRIDGSIARPLHVFPTESATHHPDHGEDIVATLRKRFPGSQFHKLSLAPGEYFPRMARPSSLFPEGSPGENPDDTAEALNVRTTSTGQLHALIQELQRICRVVHPIADNFDVYGHDIRNILILACTEVEAHWKNILLANGARGSKKNQYAKLSFAMKLGDYRVALPWFPWLDSIAPFADWPSNDASWKGLRWYDAYNAVKHDRENKFRSATLKNAIDAVTGCFVMLCAQYGWDFARRGEAASDAFFLLVDAPKWQASELYVPAYDGKRSPRQYPFP